VAVRQYWWWRNHALPRTRGNDHGVADLAAVTSLELVGVAGEAGSTSKRGRAWEEIGGREEGDLGCVEGLVLPTSTWTS
jgi:hypothetical protein